MLRCHPAYHCLVMGVARAPQCRSSLHIAHGSCCCGRSIQGGILNYTKSLCDSMGDSAATCRTYVELYGPAVFVMLQQVRGRGV